MEGSVFRGDALAIGAGISAGTISPAYACDDGAAMSSQAAPHYAWQDGYVKAGRSAWHWVQVN
jgi:hypothetical protein